MIERLTHKRCKMDTNQTALEGITDSNKHVPHRDDRRKLALLVAIDKIEKPKLPELEKALGYSPRAIQTMLKDLVGMGVIVTRVNGRRYGYYNIADTGVYDLDRATQIIQTSCIDVYEQIDKIAQKNNTVDRDDTVNHSNHCFEDTPSILPTAHIIQTS